MVQNWWRKIYVKLAECQIYDLIRAPAKCIGYKFPKEGGTLRNGISNRACHVVESGKIVELSLGESLLPVFWTLACDRLVIGPLA